MTHDELLAKIDSDIAKTDAVVGLQFCRPTLKALRAVVERHRESVEYKDIPANICLECGEKYPCPTIEDIQEQLK